MAIGGRYDTKGKTPKQALLKWLREHAAEYDLTDDEGNPQEKVIEELGKVANWKPEGGASSTPTSPPQISPRHY